jgi:hypothetical protein
MNASAAIADVQARGTGLEARGVTRRNVALPSSLVILFRDGG